MSREVFGKDHMHVWKSTAVISAKKERHMVLQVCVTRCLIQVGSGWERASNGERSPQEALLRVNGGGKSIPKSIGWKSRVDSRRKNRKKVLVVEAQSDAEKMSWARPRKAFHAILKVQVRPRF